MRRLAIIAVLALLTACGGDDESSKGVDVSTLGPLSGRERALLLAADAALRQGNIDGAEKDYLGAIEASTGHIEAHIGLAQLYLKKGQTSKAEEVLKKALAFQPKNPGANYLSGKIALGAGNHEAALAAFNNGLASAPKDLDLINGAGIANDMLANHAAAQALYQPAIAQNKGANLTALRTNLAMSYLLSGNAKAALPLLKQEFKAPNTSPVIRHNLALAYGLSGNEALAKKTIGPEGDENGRVATLEKLKAYLADTSPTKKPPVLSPSPTTSAAPVVPVE